MPFFSVEIWEIEIRIRSSSKSRSEIFTSEVYPYFPLLKGIFWLFAIAYYSQFGFCYEALFLASITHFELAIPFFQINFVLPPKKPE